jgi:hypothetical protein
MTTPCYRVRRVDVFISEARTDRDAVAAIAASLEAMVADLEAVVYAMGLERFPLLGLSR